MFTENTESVLLPYLINMMRGKSLEDIQGLNTTSHYFMSTISGKLQASEKIEDNSVVVLNIHHPIFKYDQTCGPKGTQSIIAMLEDWKDNSNVLGVVFDYFTGGGQVSGTSEVSNYINNYPKPTVAFTKDTVGSAGYYMFSASNYTIAHPKADFIGSIGTMFLKVDMQGVVEKNGGVVHEVYSDLSPEKNNVSRELKAGNPKPLIETILNPMAKQFHDEIKLFRPQISDKALKGDVFNPQQALAEGLIDQLGTLNDAINKVVALSNSNKSKTQNNMSKQRAKVQAVLGLDAPLATTDNGSYLNDQQLDALDAHMEQQDSATADLQSQLDAAQNNTDLNDQLDVANATITGAEASIDAMLTQSGLDVTGTLDEKLDALNAKVTEMSKADGDTHTKVKTKATTKEEANAFNIDANASHNQIANQIHNN